MRSRKLRKYSLNGEREMRVDVLGCTSDCASPDVSCSADLSCTEYDPNQECTYECADTGCIIVFDTGSCKDKDYNIQQI